METKDKKAIGRREFLRRLGAGAAVSAAALAGCGPKGEGAASGRSAREEIPTDKMAYRTNPKTGDKVSLLGYGCMRWPTVAQNGADEIDQEAVNELVDYAIAHGVNYFDTSPAYCKGFSERATGIALDRKSVV